MADSNKLNTMEFESEDFVQKCLEAFDANVALIENEYAVTSKSA